MFNISDDEDLDYLSSDFLDVKSPKFGPTKQRSSFELGSDFNGNTKRLCEATTNELQESKNNATTLASTRGNNGKEGNMVVSEKLNGQFNFDPAPFLRGVTSVNQYSRLSRLSTTSTSSILKLTDKEESGSLSTAASVSKSIGENGDFHSNDLKKNCESVSELTSNDMDFGLDSDFDLDLSLADGATESVSGKVHDIIVENSEQNLVSKSSLSSSLSSNAGISAQQCKIQAGSSAGINVNCSSLVSRVENIPKLDNMIETLQPKLVQNTHVVAATVEQFPVHSLEVSCVQTLGNVTPQPSSSSYHKSGTVGSLNSVGSRDKASDNKFQRNSVNGLLRTPNLQQNAFYQDKPSAPSSVCLQTPNNSVQQTVGLSTPARENLCVQEYRTPLRQNLLSVKSKTSPPMTPSSPCAMEKKQEAHTRYITPKCPVPLSLSSSGTTDDSTPKRRKFKRKFPGPAGMLPKLVTSQVLDSLQINPDDNIPKIPASTASSKTPPKVCTEPPPSQVTQPPCVDEIWQCMKEDIGPEIYKVCCNFNIASIVLQSSSKQLPSGKVPVMCAMVDSMNVLAAEASVILKDTSGEIKATVHRQVVKEFQSDLQVGCGLVLKQVGVFSPSARKHYLNITPNNVVYIYTKKDVQLSCRNVSTITMDEIEESISVDAVTDQRQEGLLGIPQSPLLTLRQPFHYNVGVQSPVQPDGRGQTHFTNNIRTPLIPAQASSRGQMQEKNIKTSSIPNTPSAETGSLLPTPKSNTLAGQSQKDRPFNNRATPTGSGVFAAGCSAKTSSQVLGTSSRYEPRPSDSAIQSQHHFASKVAKNVESRSMMFINSKSSNIGNGAATTLNSVPQHVFQHSVKYIPNQSTSTSIQGTNDSSVSRRMVTSVSPATHGSKTNSAAGNKMPSSSEPTAAKNSSSANWENDGISDLLSGLEEEMMDEMEY